MKKKIYFSISAILQIIGSIYVIAIAKDLVQGQLDSISEMYSMFPIDFQERMINMLQKSGVPFTISLSCIGIILNSIILKITLSNSILRKKEMLIVFSVICLLTAQSSIVTLLSIVNIIVLVCLKRENKEDFPIKENMEIPNLEYQKPSKKATILGVILVFAYFFQFVIGKFIPQNISAAMAITITILIYIILLIFAILAFKDKLKNDIKLFKNHTKAYFHFLLPRLGIMYAVFLFSSFISILISRHATSVNQSMLEEIPKWFLIPAAVIWAPIVEELIFRGVLRRFVKNNVLFIALSAIIFGLLHTVSEANLFNAIVMALPYSVLGGFFAYIYSKTNNLCSNILSHSFHNAIGMILMNLLLFVFL